MLYDDSCIVNEFNVMNKAQISVIFLGGGGGEKHTIILPVCFTLKLIL